MQSPASLTHDLLGRPVSDMEQQMFQVYEQLKQLAAREDLPPCAQQNVRRALACMWQVTNDLTLQYEHLYHLGI